ncbi:MAG: ATP-binding protein [Bacilli bacterium]|nr:ATP-binding protein [Bacilli bacterium]
MRLTSRNELLNRLIRVIDTPDIKVITGIRRSGKSKLLLLFKEYLVKNKHNIIHIDFNDSSFDDLREYRALENYIEKKYVSNKKNFLLIDEVQMCDGFERAINSLHNKEKFHIYITGSNAFLLSSDLATLFTGRTFTIDVFPFSFKEYMDYHHYKNIDEAFEKYFYDGGFSGSYPYQTIDDKYDYINKEVFETIIVKDICKKYKIKNSGLLQNLTSYLLDNISNLTSSNNVANYLSSHKNKITDKTVTNYIDYLCKSFLLYKVDRYDVKGKRYLVNSHKYYLSDHSLKYAKLGIKNLDIGRTYENMVAIELLRKRYDIYAGKLYNNEIDFVAMKKDEKIYIQVVSGLDNPKTLEREIKPLLSIKDAYPKIVITRSKQPEYTYEGIRIIDIASWLSK